MSSDEKNEKSNLPPITALAPQHNLLWVVLGLAVFCLVGAAALRQYTLNTENLPIIGRVGEFEFSDQHNQKLKAKELRGHVWIASFIFTRCAGTCVLLNDSLNVLNKRFADQPEIHFVSFSVDPEWDSPERLSEYAKARGSESPRWHFLTGSKKELWDVSKNQFQLGIQDAKGTELEPIIHSEKLILVDRLGRIRGYYAGTDPEAVKMLAQDTRRLNSSFGLHSLPTLNASLNGLATLLLLCGAIFIKLRWKTAHRNAMIAAGVTSGLFLACYLIYHFEAGSVAFTGVGTARTVYFAILISHVFLAIVIAALVPITFWHALSGNFEKHRRIAKITLPIWLYVSITGVVVYVMLYQLYAPGQ